MMNQTIFHSRFEMAKKNGSAPLDHGNVLVCPKDGNSPYQIINKDGIVIAEEFSEIAFDYYYC